MRIVRGLQVVEVEGVHFAFWSEQNGEEGVCSVLGCRVSEAGGMGAVFSCTPPGLDVATAFTAGPGWLLFSERGSGRLYFCQLRAGGEGPAEPRPVQWRDGEAEAHGAARFGGGCFAPGPTEQGLWWYGVREAPGASTSIVGLNLRQVSSPPLLAWPTPPTCKRALAAAKSSGPSPRAPVHGVNTVPYVTYV